jgi:hypothetical protein
VYIPFFNISVCLENYSISEAVKLARDTIGNIGIEMEDRKLELPNPAPTDVMDFIDKNYLEHIVTFVDVDFSVYRKQNERIVRRNVVLPSWLNYEAEKSGVNVSAILQKALMQELHLTER